MLEIVVRKINYSNEDEAEQLLQLLNAYALDPQGGSEALSDYANNNLIEALRNTPSALSYIAYKDEKPVGLANCFYGFSTFAAKPLINIHDLVVLEEVRGQGVGTKLLQAVEDEARATNCCKVTLEVLEQNARAQAVYKKFGFSGYDLGDAGNQALFWDKKLL